MPTIAPACFKRRVPSMSPGDGSRGPAGWLCHVSQHISCEKGPEMVFGDEMLRVRDVGLLQHPIPVLADEVIRDVLLKGNLGRLPLSGVLEENAASLCVVCPSEWYENSPYAVLEAFASGRAAVAMPRSKAARTSSPRLQLASMKRSRTARTICSAFISLMSFLLFAPPQMPLVGIPTAK